MKIEEQRGSVKAGERKKQRRGRGAGAEGKNRRHCSPAPCSSAIIENKKAWFSKLLESHALLEAPGGLEPPVEALQAPALPALLRRQISKLYKRSFMRFSRYNSPGRVSILARKRSRNTRQVGKNLITPAPLPPILSSKSVEGPPCSLYRAPAAHSRPRF